MSLLENEAQLGLKFTFLKYFEIALPRKCNNKVSATSRIDTKVNWKKDWVHISRQHKQDFSKSQSRSGHISTR